MNLFYSIYTAMLSTNYCGSSDYYNYMSYNIDIHPVSTHINILQLLKSPLIKYRTLHCNSSISNLDMCMYEVETDRISWNTLLQLDKQTELIVICFTHQIDIAFFIFQCTFLSRKYFHFNNSL